MHNPSRSTFSFDKPNDLKGFSVACFANAGVEKLQTDFAHFENRRYSHALQVFILTYVNYFSCFYFRFWITFWWNCKQFVIDTFKGVSSQLYEIKGEFCFYKRLELVAINPYCANVTSLNFVRRGMYTVSGFWIPQKSLKVPVLSYVSSGSSAAALKDKQTYRLNCKCQQKWNLSARK